MSELASGNGWTLSETEDGYMLLELKSIYGIVELKAKGLGERWMLRDVQRTYDNLKAQGVIEEIVREAI